MKIVRTTNFFGVLVRKDSIVRNGHNAQDVKDSIETKLLDENDDLLSFGPCFGEEAADNVCKKLNSFSHQQFGQRPVNAKKLVHVHQQSLESEPRVALAQRVLGQQNDRVVLQRLSRQRRLEQREFFGG